MKRLVMIFAFFIFFVSCQSSIPVGPDVDHPTIWDRPVHACIASPDVYVQPGDDIQAAVNRNSPGTVFAIMSGIHRRQSIRPKDGMAFIGERNVVLDGEGVTQFAFSGTARNVLICGLTIERYAPGAQMGAVKAGGHSRSESADGWSVENSEIRYNDGGGIRIGNRIRVVGNFIHHNSQIGIVGMGDDVVVEDNEISWNNFEKKFSYGWEAGGTKFVKTNRLVVRNNFVHNNWGPGLWTDIDNINTLYESNIVEYNADTGIFHEISYSAIIRNNVVRLNGFDRVGSWAYGAGILVAHSPDVDIYNNKLEDNQNGIMGIQQDRGSGSHGPHDLRNLWVHDNTIIQRRGKWAAGAAQDIGDVRVFDRNLKFNNNRYFTNRSQPFEWLNASRTWQQWRNFGHDQNGSLGQ